MDGFGRRPFLLALGAIPAALFACSTQHSAPTGPDMSGADPAVRPQDDLYRHVNGRWLREYQLPPDRASFGAWDEPSERIEPQLREILESIGAGASGAEEQKLRDMYRNLLDREAIEKLGLSPIAGLLADIDGAATKADLARVMGRLHAIASRGLMHAVASVGPMELTVGTDNTDATRYRPFIAQSGLGLPNESYYREPQHADIRARYRAYLESIARGAGLGDPVGSAARVADLEQRIAAQHWDNARAGDPIATYNPHSWDQLRSLAPGFDWDGWLAAISDRSDSFDTVIVRQPSFVTAVGRLWEEVPPGVWCEYLRLAVVRTFAPYLPTDIADRHFDFFGTTIEGQQQRPPRWKWAIEVLGHTLGELLGKHWLAKYFPPEAKSGVLELVSDLKAACRARFERSDWMSPPTRAAAIAKLEKMETLIGYPERWRDYSGVTVIPGELITSLLSINIAETRRQVGQLGRPVDRGDWYLTPQSVNAGYDLSLNQIVFPAGILQRPYFDKDAARAVNYGGIGAVIGHEIGHAFDDLGSKYDGDGKQRDWWAPQDRAAFEKKIKALIEQYNVLVPDLLPEHHVDGALTVGQNLADLHGLLLAVTAYEITERARGVVNPDYAAVFQSYARIRREKIRPEALAARLATYQDAPSEFRCNQVIRNIPEFYTAFGVRPTDKLFLPEEQRVVL
ncbi:M13 family metallopeptidase [Nocardia sp. CDC159]|uniref:M13 family metallopeptidase n=1 Tax=Nocardia pulmonis TaxID=2951408 RepID=A0A9X2J060_9NOCA|nr:MULTISPECIES: M13 family metallopeptidase [Nocardia]MCM6778852.1 M13 family metallopeptidase [Nocardia pulmonis]MCM6791741.1 M13 family metallopeptidase [Nocardia sp. CDC159]